MIKDFLILFFALFSLVLFAFLFFSLGCKWMDYCVEIENRLISLLAASLGISVLMSPIILLILLTIHLNCK